MKVFQTEVLSYHEDDTIKLGKWIGKHLIPGNVVALIGPLGSGKTILTKGIAAGLGFKGNYPVSSPSYVIINYYSGKIPIYHMDFYRIKSTEELEDLGYEEYFYGNGALIVEWADKFLPYFPPERMQIEIKVLGEHSRKLKIKGIGEKYEWVKEWKGRI